MLISRCIFDCSATLDPNTNAMPYSLRKRISKRIASLKDSPTEREQSSPVTGRVSEDISQAELMQAPQNEQPPLRDAPHITTPPALIHDRRSSPEVSSKKSSPPQMLLDRYKNREAPPVMATTHATRSSGRDTSFSEDFHDESPARSPEGVEVPGTLYYPSEEDVRVLGVKFEMMGKKGQAAEAPKIPADDDVFSYERRRTRSQTRRSQRADSAEVTDAPKLPTSDDHLKPPGLTIRKISDRENSRTPSPQAVSEVNSLIAGSIAPTPSNSPNASAIPNTLIMDITKKGAEYRLSGSPDPLEKVDKPVSRGLRRKAEEVTEAIDAFPPTLVVPPIYSPNILTLDVWCSPLASTSRPEMRWGWMKKWVCCKCASRDPNRRERPVITMAEQKVCSRLSCQHVRCARGCEMMFCDTTFHTVSPFD